MTRTEQKPRKRKRSDDHTFNRYRLDIISSVSRVDVLCTIVHGTCHSPRTTPSTTTLPSSSFFISFHFISLLFFLLYHHGLSTAIAASFFHDKTILYSIHFGDLLNSHLCTFANALRCFIGCHRSIFIFSITHV